MSAQRSSRPAVAVCAHLKPNLRPRTWDGRTITLGLALVAALFGGATASPVLAAQGQKVCYKCKGTGKVASKTPPPEAPVLHDSAYYRSDKNGGVGYALCTRTPNEEAKRDYEDRKEEIAEWMSALDSYEKTTGAPATAVETESVRVFLSLPKVRVDGKRCNRVKGARRYTEYLQTVYERYREVMGIAPDKIERGPTPEFLITKDQKAFSAYLREHFGQSGDNAAGLNSKNGKINRYVTRLGDESDEDLEQRIVYTSGSMFLFRYDRLGAPPAWLEIGFCSWLEHDFYGTNKNTTFSETPPADAFRGGLDWKDKIADEVRSKDFIPLVELQAKELNALTYRDIAYGFSWVDFLIEHDVEKFRELVKILKRGRKDTMDTILEVYGWLPAEIDEKWTEFVRSNY